MSSANSEREMVWRGRWERGSGLGTHVHPWWIHVNVWQNQYSSVKQNKVKIKILNRKRKEDIKQIGVLENLLGKKKEV